jgi:hypothetical protein
MSKKRKQEDGRPKTFIDWEDVGKALNAQSKTKDIAASYGICSDTLTRRCLDETKMTFSAFAAQKRSEGKENMRRKMYEIAMKGNVSMLIFLSKQPLYLGYKDKHEETQKEESKPIPLNFAGVSVELKP